MSSAHVQTRPRSIKRRVCIVAALLSLLTLGTAAPPPAADLPRPPTPDLTDRPAFQVVDVRAGNVIVIEQADQRREIRLVGTYIPNVGSNNDQAWPYLRRLLTGESVYIDYEPDWPLRDRHDRYWAYIRRAPDGLFVNLELIRLGYARLSAQAPFEHQPLFRAYEQHARRCQKGLWSPEPPDQQPTTQPAADNTTAAGQAAGAAAPTTQPADDSVTVYITPSGKKYHRADCPYLRGGGMPISRQAAREQGFEPCRHCHPDDPDP